MPPRSHACLLDCLTGLPSIYLPTYGTPYLLIIIYYYCSKELIVGNLEMQKKVLDAWGPQVCMTDAA
jgi:hypothetical protein